jgi:hypothetical protein
LPVTCVRIETGYWVPKHLLIDDGLAQLDDELEHVNFAHPSACRRVPTGIRSRPLGILAPSLSSRHRTQCEAELAVAVVEDFTSGGEKRTKPVVRCRVFDRHSTRLVRGRASARQQVLAVILETELIMSCGTTAPVVESRDSDDRLRLCTEPGNVRSVPQYHALAGVSHVRRR